MKNDNTGQRRTTRAVRCLAGAAMLGATLVALPQRADAQTVTAPPVPDNIQVPAPNQPFLLGHGVGTQNYECQPSPSIGQVGWVLFTPEATLFSDEREQLTTHFFSPNPAEGSIVRATWEHSGDTSTVWARATASSTDPAFVNANAVAWLLLRVVGSQTGPTGGNTLSATTFIQRVNTSGGTAPATGCSLPTDIGHKAFVPYTADYIFFRQ